MALITLSPYSLNSTLDYTFNNVSATGTVTANGLTVSNVSGVVNFTTTANVTLGSVSNLHISGGSSGYYLQTDGTGNLTWAAGGGGGGGTPGGTDTQVQFNDAGSFGGNAGFVFNKTTTTLTANNFVATSTANLGAVANIVITGGSSGYVLSTDGAGVLSWVAQSGGGGGGASISNGNSNVNIPSANGNINMTAVGNTTMVVTGTGANIFGTLNVTGNATVGNLLTSGSGGNLTSINVVSANTFIASNSVTVTSNANVGNLNATTAVIASIITSNVATGTAPLTVTSTTLVSNLYVARANVADNINVTAPGTGTGYMVFANATTGNVAELTSAGISADLATNAITATTFIGVFANGNSTISIPAANGNINFSAAGTPDELVITSTGVNVAGTLNANGNVTFTGTTLNFGSNANVKITGGTSGQILSTDGAGNLSWATGGGGGGGSISITDDTTTNSNVYYPILATITSGSLSTANVSAAELFFNPFSGTLNATVFNSLSDRNKKSNIELITNALSKVLTLNGVTFNLIDSNELSAGLIAQDVEKVLPNAVKYNNNVRSLNYSGVIGLLVESTKEQQLQIEELKQISKEQQLQIEELKQLINKQV